MAAKGALRRATKNSRLTPALRCLDGRASEARTIRKFRDCLLADLPQPVSAVAAQLAERCAILAMHLITMDREALQDGGLKDRIKLYLALSSQHQRLLRQLGAMKAPRRAPGTGLLAQLAAASSAA